MYLFDAHTIDKIIERNTYPTFKWKYEIFTNNLYDIYVNSFSYRDTNINSCFFSELFIPLLSTRLLTEISF